VFGAVRAADIIPTLIISDNSVEIPRVQNFLNNASIQPGEFATKAESDITYEMVSQVVRTFAHWIPASRQILGDAPMLRSDIDSHLVDGLQDKIDEALIYGDGQAPNLLGLLVDPLVPDVGIKGTKGYAKHIRDAITILERARYRPSHILLSPEGFGEIEGETDDNKRYLWANPQNSADKRLWGIPCVVTPTLQENDFVVGNFTQGIRIYSKGSIDIRVSDSHSTFFVKNGIAVLAETELTSAIVRPAAFVKGSFAEV
jgi:HK97 family phage major capsid protein